MHVEIHSGAAPWVAAAVTFLAAMIALSVAVDNAVRAPRRQAEREALVDARAVVADRKFYASSAHQITVPVHNLSSHPIRSVRIGTGKRTADIPWDVLQAPGADPFLVIKPGSSALLDGVIGTMEQYIGDVPEHRVRDLLITIDWVDYQGRHWSRLNDREPVKVPAPASA